MERLGGADERPDARPRPAGRPPGRGTWEGRLTLRVLQWHRRYHHTEIAAITSRAAIIDANIALTAGRYHVQWPMLYMAYGVECLQIVFFSATRGGRRVPPLVAFIPAGTVDKRFSAARS